MHLAEPLDFLSENGTLCKFTGVIRMRRSRMMPKYKINILRVLRGVGLGLVSVLGTMRVRKGQRGQPLVKRAVFFVVVTIGKNAVSLPPSSSAPKGGLER